MTETWYKSSGTIVYDPPRPKLRKRPDHWVVINADYEIARYFRYWVDKEVLNPLGFEKGGLAEPSWGAHISIIRGLNDIRNCPFDWKTIWKRYHGQKVEFEYSNKVRYTGDTTGHDRPGDYWFVEVRCPLAEQIRDEFKLIRDWSLHLTIGRTWPDRVVKLKK